MIVAPVEEICAFREGVEGSQSVEFVPVPEELGTFEFPDGEPDDCPELWQEALNGAYEAMAVERPANANGSGVIGSAWP